MESVFTNVYENKLWGNNNCIEYSGSSGGGSDINYNIRQIYKYGSKEVSVIEIN